MDSLKLEDGIDGSEGARPAHPLGTVSVVLEMSGLRLWALLHYHVESGPRSNSPHFHGDRFCRTSSSFKAIGAVFSPNAVSPPLARRSKNGAGTVFSLPLGTSVFSDHRAASERERTLF